MGMLFCIYYWLFSLGLEKRYRELFTQIYGLTHRIPL